MHPVGRHFGAAVRERTAAATGRRRLARQVHLLRGLRPDAGLVSALQDAVTADHGKSGRTEMGAEGAEVRPDHPARDPRGCIGNKQQEDDIQAPTLTFLQ